MRERGREKQLLVKLLLFEVDRASLSCLSPSNLDEGELASLSALQPCSLRLCDTCAKPDTADCCSSLSSVLVFHYSTIYNVQLFQDNLERHGLDLSLECDMTLEPLQTEREYAQKCLPR